jgi:hypothetical protein
MANPLLRPVEAWQNGQPVTQSEWSQLDGELTSIVNGDDGGTYAIANDDDTTIGGAGLWLAASPNHTLSGTDSSVFSGTGAPIVHAADDYTLLEEGHTGRARSLATPVERAPRQRGWQTSGVGSLYSTLIGGDLLVPLRVHDSARLVTATLRFSVGSSHDAPAFLPKMRIVRVDAFGNATPLTTNALDGFVYATRPALASQWFAGGATRTIALSVDVNPVDVHAFTYFAHVVDEQGSGAAAGNYYRAVVCSFDTIVDMRPQ